MALQIPYVAARQAGQLGHCGGLLDESSTSGRGLPAVNWSGCMLSAIVHVLRYCLPGCCYLGSPRTPILESDFQLFLPPQLIAVL